MFMPSRDFLKAVSVLALLLSQAAIAVSASSEQAATSSSSQAADTTKCRPASEFCQPTPVCPETGSGEVDMSGKTLINTNFGGGPPGRLKGANFSNTTLIGVNFSGVDLTDANFSGAKTLANDDGLRTDFTGTGLHRTCFAGADLGAADLRYATFDQTDLTCARLSEAKFGSDVTFEGDREHRTRFDYSELGIALDSDSDLFPLDSLGEATPEFWSQTNFTCTSFIGLDSDSFKPAGRDMTGAILVGVVLDGFGFYDEDRSKGATFDRADLSGISLRGADLRSASLDGVKLVGADLTSADLTEARLYKTAASDLTRAVLDNSKLNHASLAHVTLSGASLNRVQARKASFDSCTMQATDKENVASVINSDFSHSVFRDASLNGVTFRGCTLSHADLANVTLSSTSFGGATMVAASFENASLNDVDFAAAQLNNVKFNGTRFGGTRDGAGVDFTCSQLGGADFRDARVDKANFQAAVAPPDDDCCRPKDGVGVLCGRAADGTVYGHTTLPDTGDAPVTCPNGRRAPCKSQDWVLPGWKSDLCGSGREQTLWHKPDCDHVPSTVKIDDPNLRACVQEALFDGAKQPITKEAAAALEFLNCANRKVESLEGLEKANFPNIKTLDLSGNALAGEGDFSKFSEKLEEVKLSSNQYTGLRFSSKQDRLDHLEASNNQIDWIEMSPDAYFSYLDLSRNKLERLPDDFFQQDNEVYFLDLSDNDLEDMGDASILKEARTIYLQNNQLQTIGSVESLWPKKTLKYLSLGGNECFQCGTLGVDKETWEQFGCTCDPKNCSPCN